MYYDISFRKTEHSKDMDYVRCPDFERVIEWLRENGGSVHSILILQLEGGMPCEGGRTHG